MSEKVSIKEMIDWKNIVGHCVLNAISYSPELKEATKDIRDAQEVEVVLTINGIEVSLRNFLNRFEEEHDRMLMQQCKELMDQKFSGINNMMHQAEQAMKDHFQRAFPDYDWE